MEQYFNYNFQFKSGLFMSNIQSIQNQKTTFFNDIGKNTKIIVKYKLCTENVLKNSNNLIRNDKK